MALKIVDISPGSLAAKAGLEPGDELISLNGQELRDEFDLSYYSAVHTILLKLRKASGEVCEVKLIRRDGRPLGIEVQPYKHKNCQNNCIFCFIDQMPRGLRRSLYQKDDDYIFSYVYGNYITLTNLSDAEIERIIAQQINPLYISLHTTDANLRQHMMRSRHPVPPMSLLSRLSAGGISFHLQIVLVPDVNDGLALQNTINDLMLADFDILSLGIVPVGLTKYREKLTPLKPFDGLGARKLLQAVKQWRRMYATEIIYAADEFYVLANQNIPDYRYYNDFPQIENGIGMLRFTKNEYQMMRARFRKELRDSQAPAALVTSRSAARLMQWIVYDLNRTPQPYPVRLLVINNDFLGEHISVAGLITFSDLAAQVKLKPQETLILPQSMFNGEGLTLDGASIQDLKTQFGTKVLLVDQFFESWDWL